MDKINIIDYLRVKLQISQMSLPVTFGIIDIVQILLIAVFVY